MSDGKSLERLRVFVGSVLLTLYATASVVSLTNENYSVPTELHALMAIVAGALFGPSILKRGDPK